MTYLISFQNISSSCRCFSEIRSQTWHDDVQISVRRSSSLRTPDCLLLPCYLPLDCPLPPPTPSPFTSLSNDLISPLYHLAMPLFNLPKDHGTKTQKEEGRLGLPLVAPFHCLQSLIILFLFHPSILSPASSALCALICSFEDGTGYIGGMLVAVGNEN